MRIVFMGTPDIAKDALTALLQAGHTVAGVFTRADKPVGRKQVLTPPPVKVLALENQLPVYQPRTLREPEALETLQKLAPELIVVVAYGRILPPAVLALPAYGCINLHVSLLPQYRGAAPIQWAVINGEKTTGVTIMQMDEGLDTGPILAQQPVEVGPNDTAGHVFATVSHIGARLLCDTVEKIGQGEVQAIPQLGEASLAPPLTKAMARMDFARPANELHNLARGCNPWPLAWFEYENKRIKVTTTHLDSRSGPVGEVLSTQPLSIGCGVGALVLEHVVPEGSRPMAGEDWAMGRRFKIGDKLF